MCYFSAEGHSRDAREGEALIVRRQPHGTNWLVSPENASTPVCLRTGTEVELLYIPAETQRRFGLTQEATALFETNHWWWPDLLVLRNGRRVRLKKLQEGQVVRVLSLPTEAIGLHEDRAQTAKAPAIRKREEAKLADYR